MTSFESILTLVFTGLFALMLLFGGVLINLIAHQRRLRSTLPVDSIFLEPHIRKSFFAYSTIAGSLTSFSAVFLFFLLYSNRFGYLLFVSVLTIPLGGLIAKKIQTKALARYHVCANSMGLLNSGTLSGILSPISGPQVSQIVRIISVVILAAFLWLELKEVSKFLVVMIDADASSAFIAITAGSISFLLALYVFRFGMTGIVVSDIIYWPTIILTVIVIIILLSLQLWEIHGFTIDIAAQKLRILVKPKLETAEAIAWIVNVFFLNITLVAVRDDHWCRIPAFGTGLKKQNMAIQHLPMASVQAAFVGFLLIVAGFLFSLYYSYSISNSANENVRFLPTLNQAMQDIALLRPVVLLGALAAMLSTANGIIFALGRNFGPIVTPTHANQNPTTKQVSPFIAASVLAVIFSVSIYAVLIFPHIERLVIVPLVNMPVAIMPGLFASLFLGSARPIDFTIPLLLHIAISSVALYFDNTVILYLSAPISFVIGFLMVFLKRQDPEHSLMKRE